MKRYEDYTSNDFVLDEDFQDWVMKPNAENEAFWSHWLKNHPEKQQEVTIARNQIRKLMDGLSAEPLPAEDLQATWQRIQERKNHRITTKKTLWRSFLRLAAACVALALVGYGLNQYHQPNNIVETGTEEVYSGITLELQDGSVVALKEGENGVITLDAGNGVARQVKHELVYTTEDSTTERGGELVFNTLNVPYGKNFALTLSDGSHVFLNAGSSLRYPVRFLPDKPRDVFLDGEAFFTVAPDKNQSFTVRTADMDTRVYGTRFNVTSYQNDQNSYTVLVEGRVGVSKRGSSELQETSLEPGQRAVFDHGTIQVETADVDKYTSWVDGTLLFSDDRFELILKKLERHFDVRIDNRFSALNQRRFTGTFRKKETLEQILAVFDAHTPFEYSRVGRVITIHPSDTM